MINSLCLSEAVFRHKVQIRSVHLQLAFHMQRVQ